MPINQIRATYERSADNITHAGGIGSLIIGVINNYSPNEWMIIGIIVGMICSLVGLFFSIMFKYRREKMLEKYLASHDVIAAARLLGE